MNEFELIRRYFEPCQASRQSSQSSQQNYIGDDAAILDIPVGYQLVTATDTLLPDVHFPADANASDIAARALLTNISDIVAMGATPHWYQLALSLPEVNHHWLTNFSSGLLEINNRYGVSLIGGDTTRGSLNISIQMLGLVATGTALKRSNAQSGDDIWVTHSLGVAAYAVKQQLWEKSIADGGDGDNSGVDSFRSDCLRQYYRPHIALDFALQAKQLINAAIDISDGLIADLTHICQQSRCSAQIHCEQIPHHTNIPIELALYGGDDYQLCFTADIKHREALKTVAEQCATRLHRIGTITEERQQHPTLQLMRNQQPVELSESHGYKHF